MKTLALITCLGIPVLAMAPRVEAAPAATQAIELHFRAQIGRMPARCDATYENVGTSGAALFLQDFRIYVSAVRLLTRSGREVPLDLTPDGIWQNDKVALLDFENASGNCNGNTAMNDRIQGTIPAADYVGLVFELGVPFEMNHQDPTLAAAPLNYSALTWPWAVGYKFTTIDFDTRPPAQRTLIPIEGTTEKVSASGFSIHLGSTECASSGPRVPPQVPCRNPNRPTFRFAAFDARKDVLVMDLGALLARTDVTVNMPQSPSGCMSSAKDDDCIGIMDRFGLSFRGMPSPGQQFIRSEH
ncbi:MAG: metallo-mystery pair system four-Cys motif protein [Rhodospirillales bacterium]|nr:metallo-mystery pair system four-Cys motif protein [Rhodospirillales bacterium]